ncbi:glycosyltransferase family 4 protein [Dietzia sp. SL131]|nr:glycosyltransferase family 4 protein [Dietzia sp. SL131]
MHELSKEWRVSIAGPVSASLKERYEGPNYVGQIPGHDIPEFISGHVCGLAIYSKLANYQYGVPTKVFEYMAAGRPFIVTDLPGCVELFAVGAGGMVVDTDDLDAIFEAISLIMGNPTRSVQLGQEARKAFLERFSFDSEALRLCSFYSDLNIRANGSPS